MMKKNIYLFVVLLFLSLSVEAREKDEVVMQSMLERLIPAFSEYFQFKKIKAVSGKDCFRLESKDSSKIIISGNNANSMAMGLNYYLKYYCLTTISWYADVPVEMPEVLPTLKEPLNVEAKVDRRFFLNYCTYGYTMPFWKWEDWERLIDWMALNGINMPLAITGQESVWYEVWKDMGLTDEEIRSYFTGPSYLPWHRMANIDGWNGPLPMQWLDDQKELQKKILARERELNMKPVLPAFSGHVPSALKRLYPNANIKNLSQWGGFSEEYRCSFLNPEEPLFATIQKKFLQEQTHLFGTDHIYGVDPFNEVDPPSWEPEYLSRVSAGIYHTLTATDPKAEWMQMTWMFYYDRKNWTAPRVKALLTGVPQDKMVLLDYYCENVELWKTTESFYGQPYIWCYLGNFGGNTMLFGNVKESGARLDNALVSGGNNLKGIGSTLEGLDVEQFPYEYIFEKAWTLNTNDRNWTDALADRHVGAVSQPVREAWAILFDRIYTQISRTHGRLLSFRPVMSKANDRTFDDYSNVVLLQAWQKLLQSSNCNRDALQLDIIAVGRQLLGNYFQILKEDFDRMYEAKDLIALEARAAEMREILNDLENLNAFHNRCSLDKWIADARSLGNTPELKDYYEKNTRNLITTWGGSLSDYASRTWAGLIKDYYSIRWDMYINSVLFAVKNNQEFNQRKFDDSLKVFENSWVESNYPIETEPRGDLLIYARFLQKKYERRINVE